MNGKGKIAVIGLGLIGRAWAIVFARAGFEVRLYGNTLESRESALSAIVDSLRDLDEFGLLEEQIGSISERITVCDSLSDALDDVLLVQENIGESVDEKRALFSDLDRLAPNDALLVSSTSGLPASTFTEHLAGRGRCLVGHPVNPPSLLPLVELCGSPWTERSAIEKAYQIFREAGQKPVIVNREIPGFLLNRLQGALLEEALSLYAQGYATADDLDTVMTEGLGLRWSFMGPFETIDLNAPRGVSDYASRYSRGYEKIAATRLPFDWDVSVVEKLDSERRAALPLNEIEGRQRWRDRRLMALLAHRQKDGSDS